MALESVSAAETQIESNNDEDLEDGEIPSDEDDEPIPPPITPKPAIELAKPIAKEESTKNKINFDSKFNKNKKLPAQTGSKLDRFSKYKNPSEDWAGDVEKAIKAALEADKAKNQDNKNKNKNNRSKSRKRSREERDDERSKEQKRRKPSDEEDGNEDDDEMLFVRGASPIRKDSRDNSSPPRRQNNDYDSYDSGSDYEERSGFNRHRDNDNKRGGRGGRRGGKNDRGGGKNKGRGHMRNDRNNRRNQNNDHIQDPDSVCVYFMQGKCHRGDDCPFSHNALPPRKMELCKFYLMDCCAKREKCLYMHHDFPCKFFHTGLKCTNAENCKFSHSPLNEQVKNILLKHLETAPKEILGDFPRLSREGALMMINNTAKAAQGQLTQISGNQKIPSLFELHVQVPNSGNAADGKEDDGENAGSQPKSGTKDRKSPGKKTRWGSDEDRVPYEQIMLLQSANQLGLQLPNAALGLAVQKQLQQQLILQQRIASMGFYNESNANAENERNKEAKEREDFTNDIEGDEGALQVKKCKDEKQFDLGKDVDLRQLLTQPAKPPVVSIAEEAANLTTKVEEESDRDEDTKLVIEMPVEDEENRDRSSEKLKIEEHQSMSTQSSNVSLTSGMSIDDGEIPSHLPKKAQELFLRIQQLQRAAQDSFKNMDDEDDKDDMENQQGDWYSDDDDDDDDDGNNLTIVLKDTAKEENDADQPEVKPNIEKEPLPPAIPQPAAIVDKLGDLSKIDISAEVSKLLSTIKAQSSTTSSKNQQKAEQGMKNSGKSSSELSDGPSATKKAKIESSSDYGNQGLKGKIDVYSNALAPQFNQNSDISSADDRFKSIKEEGIPSPKSSPNINAITSSTSAPVSRDPRMSRDPRQRRDDHKLNSPPPSGRSEPKKESKPLRIENSIYSSGIINSDAHMDTDLRTTSDQDHRRKDMDLRQRFTSDFGDTDLRVVTPSVTRSDIDLRQMLSLPFKPAPSHVPCTEIDASISSHPPIPFKVYVVDIPRPYYTGLKLTRNDPQVKNDPRLRKIFRITDADLADSPMSPPPVKPDTPKSPPQVRTDPRRKALENSNQSTSAGNINASLTLGAQQQSVDNAMGMNTQGMPMGLGANAQIMGNMGPMNMMGNMGGGNGPMMGNMGGPMPPMSNMPPMGNIGPNGSHMGPPPNQMNFDPRFAQRNSGAGLLGPAPSVMGGFGHEGQNYEGPNFPPGNFNNFGPNDNMMGFGPNGPPPPPNFGGNGGGGGGGGGGDWNGGNQSQSNNNNNNSNNSNNNGRRGGRIRRRNRNRSNNNGGSRRSPP